MANYYVSLTGDDSDAGTIMEPWRYVSNSMTKLGQGDTLWVRGGTYTGDWISNLTPTVTFTSGSNWTNAPKVKVYDEETVVFKNTDGIQEMLIIDGDIAYWEFEGMKIDGEYDSGTDNLNVVKLRGCHHIRFTNVEITGSHDSAVLVTKGSITTPFITSHEFIGCEVHSSGDSHFDHGIYISTSGNLVKGCHVYGNSSYGLHIYSADNIVDNIIEGNLVHDNSTISASGANILVGSGDDHIVRNNVCYDNVRGIYVDFGSADDCLIYNNTVYNCDTGIEIGSNATGAIVRNNLVHSSDTNAYVNNGTSTTASNNRFNDTDPVFVDADNDDYRIDLGSPCINAGFTLASVTEDYDGTSRPQGASYDIGAFEYISAGVSLPITRRGRIFACGGL